MSSRRNWKVGVTLVLAIAFVVTAGGLVIGSNLGFKINRNINGKYVLSGGAVRDNYISLPYNHPYNNAQDLCSALGITNGTIIKINHQAGGTKNSIGTLESTSCIPPLNSNGCATGVTCTETGMSYSCGSLALTNVADLSCISSSGVQARDALSTAPDTRGQVLVGSSNETKSFPIIRGAFLLSAAPRSDTYVSIPYHSTYVNSADVCTSIPGLATSGAQIIRRQTSVASNGAPITDTCPSSAAFNLVLGESLLIRKNGTTAGNCNGTTDICNFLPPHF